MSSLQEGSLSWLRQLLYYSANCNAIILLALTWDTVSQMLKADFKSLQPDIYFPPPVSTFSLSYAITMLGSKILGWREGKISISDSSIGLQWLWPSKTRILTAIKITSSVVNGKIQDSSAIARGTPRSSMWTSATKRILVIASLSHHRIQRSPLFIC